MESYIISERVGAILPKDPAKLTNVKCKNKAIAEEIRQIAELAFYNIELGRWTEEDYESFRYKLTRMELEAFKSACPEILYFMTMPKKCLKIKLEALSSILKTNTFSDERVVIEIPIKQIIDEEEVITIKKEYKMMPHQFKVGDIVSFLATTYAYISKFSGILVNQYQDRVNSCKTSKDKSLELELLYDLLNSGNEKLLSLIRQEYENWYKDLPENNNMKIYLDGMFQLAVDRNKKEVRDKISFYKKEHDSSYRNYIIQSKGKYFDEQSIRPKRRTYKRDDR